jgi:hypothetical protein
MEQQLQTVEHQTSNMLHTATLLQCCCCSAHVTEQYEVQIREVALTLQRCAALL